MTVTFLSAKVYSR